MAAEQQQQQMMMMMMRRQQQQGGGLELPPGFRFHPTDEEIITFYLTPKVLDRAFCATAVGEVDLNKSEPWDLPGKAKMGEKEWYFYCQKDRKYPTGMRTNRATEAGYWKATGKDKDIYRGGAGAGGRLMLVGMKKTLVFYKGRAPRGEKTNWVMHEYRLHAALHLAAGAHSKDDWVVCRIFHKTSGIKKPPPPSYHYHMPADHLQLQVQPPAAAAAAFIPLDSAAAACALPPLIDPPTLYASSPAHPPAGAPSYQLAAALQMPPAPPMFFPQMPAAAGFMAGPASGPSSMVSQDTLSNDHNNAAAAAEISSAVNMGIDAIWKY